jgi:hypothetical protein
MDNPAVGVSFIGYIPYFLYAERVNLRVSSVVQVKCINQLLCQGSSCSFGENRNLCPDIDTRLVIALAISLFIDAFIAGADPGDAVSIHQHFNSGKSGEHIDTIRFYLFAQPSDEAAQGNDGISMVL